MDENPDIKHEHEIATVLFQMGKSIEEIGKFLERIKQRNGKNNK